MVSNIFYFYPHLGKWSNLTNIFQMGWNNQLEIASLQKWSIFVAVTSGGSWLQRNSSDCRNPKVEIVTGFTGPQGFRCAPKQKNQGRMVWCIGVALPWIFAPSMTRWWQLEYSLCSPRNLGEMNPIWRAYYSDGLVQPPTSNRKKSYSALIRYVYMGWVWPPPSTSGKWRFRLGSPNLKI